MWTLCLIGLAQGATWTVDPAGGGDAITVAAGVALLSDGDTLRIAAGTYDVLGLRVGVNNVRIEGAGRDLTVFDGGAASDETEQWGVSSHGEDVQITGLTFRDYRPPDFESGAALYLSGATLVTDCAFVNNKIGVWLSDSLNGEAEVFDTVFAGNAWGVFLYESFDALRVEGSVFVDNDVGVEYSMGTYETMYFNRLSLVYDTFVGWEGEGVVLSGGPSEWREPGFAFQLEIVNNLFSGGGLRWALDAPSWAPETSTIRNNVYSSTTRADDGGLVFDDIDNQEAEVVFEARSDDGDWTNDDLRLAEGSPGLDAGVGGFSSRGVDAYGTPRSVDGDGDGLAAPDVGAYERCPSGDCADADTGDSGAGDSGAGGSGAEARADGEPGPAASSCSCASAGPASGLLPWGALALSLWRRRPARPPQTTRRSR